MSPLYIRIILVNLKSQRGDFQTPLYVYRVKRDQREGNRFLGVLTSSWSIQRLNKKEEIIVYFG